MTTTKSSVGPLRCIIYTRVSTGRQAESGLGLIDQVQRARQAVEAHGGVIVLHAEDAGISGGRIKNRPGLSAAIEMLDRGDADCLITAKLDRLSRSLLDFAGLMEQSRRKKWTIVCLDIGVDTSTPHGEAMANMVATFAQLEKRLIADRTAASHRVRRERGQRAGQVPILPTEVRQRIVAELEQGRSLRQVAEALNTEGVPTAKGGIWHASTVRHVAQSVAKEVQLAAAAQAAQGNAQGSTQAA